VLVGAATVVHEVVHSKGRIENYEAKTPPKLYSFVANEPEASASFMKCSGDPSLLADAFLGFAATDALFGGEILLLFGKGGDAVRLPTLANMQDPSVFDHNLRFAPTEKLKPRAFYMILDEWVVRFLEDIERGAIANRIDSTPPADIPLVPATHNSGQYKPPSMEEIQSLCSRPNFEEEVATIGGRGQRRRKTPTQKK